MGCRALFAERGGVEGTAHEHRAKPAASSRMRRTIVLSLFSSYPAFGIPADDGPPRRYESDAAHEEAQATPYLRIEIVASVLLD